MAPMMTVPGTPHPQPGCPGPAPAPPLPLQPSLPAAAGPGLLVNGVLSLLRGNKASSAGLSHRSLASDKSAGTGGCSQGWGRGARAGLQVLGAVPGRSPAGWVSPAHRMTRTPNAQAVLGTGVPGKQAALSLRPLGAGHVCVAGGVPVPQGCLASSWLPPSGGQQRPPAQAPPGENRGLGGGLVVFSGTNPIGSQAAQLGGGDS